MQINNYNCIPIKLKNDNIMLTCSPIKMKESFKNTIDSTNYYGVFRQMKKFPIYYYNPLKIYKVGDIVVRNMKAYIMTKESSSSGNDYAPPNQSYYVPLDYQNNSFYLVGDIVNGSDGYIYVLISHTGKADNSNGPPSNNWQVLG
jgi:hypothetical protein